MLEQLGFKSIVQGRQLLINSSVDVQHQIEISESGTQVSAGRESSSCPASRLTRTTSNAIANRVKTKSFKRAVR